MQTNTQNKHSIPIAVIIAGVLIAGAIFYSSGKNKITNNPYPQAGTVDINDVDMTNEPFIGNTDAPVTLAYWADFQCPFCKRFDLQTLPTLVNQYIKNGKLKVIFKDFQFLGPDSQTAGLAAKAVWELYPDRYFAWHQTIFEAQDGENSGFGSKEDIIGLTRTIEGIDADAVARLMDQKQAEYQEEQNEDKAEGISFGIKVTPGFIIGSQTIFGAQPASVFVELIEIELNK